jgi:hypothetical protein
MNDRMEFKPTNPRPTGETIAASYRLASAAFSRSWLLGLLIALSSSLETVYQLSGADPERLLEPFPHDPVYWLIYVIGLVLAQYFVAALYLRLDATASGREGDDDVLRFAFARLPSFVVMNALFAVALIAGTLLLIVPGLILTVSLAISSPVLLFDSKGPLESLRESHRLVWGHWWHTGTVLGIGGLVAIGVLLVCLITVAILAALVAHGDVLTVATATTLIVAALTGMLAMPFLLALVLNVYWDLKLRRHTEVGLK